MPQDKTYNNKVVYEPNMTIGIDTAREIYHRGILQGRVTQVMEDYRLEHRHKPFEQILGEVISGVEETGDDLPTPFKERWKQNTDGWY